uniref:Uncharacterized protein n=1 Tax=Hyaloperonospora arabidopsidis (strain Emoy2) TaxID=559515 RepID=M4BY90_HYAAE
MLYARFPPAPRCYIDEANRGTGFLESCGTLQSDEELHLIKNSDRHEWGRVVISSCRQGTAAKISFFL